MNSDNGCESGWSLRSPRTQPGSPAGRGKDFFSQTGYEARLLQPARQRILDGRSILYLGFEMADNQPEVDITGWSAGRARQEMHQQWRAREKPVAIRQTVAVPVAGQCILRVQHIIIPIRLQSVLQTGTALAGLVADDIHLVRTIEQRDIQAARVDSLPARG